MTLPDLLAPLLSAMAVSAFVLLLSAALALWKPGLAQRVSTWIAPSAAFLAGSLFVRGLPRLPPADSAGWLWWAVAGAAIAGPLFRHPPRYRNPAAFVVSLGLSCALLQPLAARVWASSVSMFWIGGTATVGSMAWLLIDRAGSARSVWQPLLLLLFAVFALSTLLSVSGTLSYGLYALALCGAVAAPALASILPVFRTLLPDPRPASAVIAIPWTGLLLGGWFYAGVPLLSVILAVISLSAFALPAIPTLGDRSSARLFTLQILLLAFPLGGSIAYSLLIGI